MLCTACVLPGKADNFHHIYPILRIDWSRPHSLTGVTRPWTRVRTRKCLIPMGFSVTMNDQKKKNERSSPNKYTYKYMTVVCCVCGTPYRMPYTSNYLMIGNGLASISIYFWVICCNIWRWFDFGFWGSNRIDPQFCWTNSMQDTKAHLVIIAPVFLFFLLMSESIYHLLVLLS